MTFGVEMVSQKIFIYLFYQASFKIFKLNYTQRKRKSQFSQKLEL